ncbi:hypothetical protein PV328_009705 [Microctonus aethiopoides]|uniref:Cytochrome c oxidase assembly protein COX11, mitochondrial n=1 Tax=Microctonus aethiopoides TaxID=144406 RepID=A0AA39C6I8_9HYME|nr:hypothetical protein PV328_009705 [Microctonus aethiopoides]
MLLKLFQCSAKINTRYFFTNITKNSSKKFVPNEKIKKENRKTVHYFVALGVCTIGMAYAAVPLYRLFCQTTSYGGTVTHNIDGVEKMEPVQNRKIRVKFNADVGSSMTWNFKPQQREITVAPGETALAFYTATNPTDVPIIGVSTYNVIPFEAGQYFNKIQCFCFEEQRLNPHESVDMPVFFYIDPEYADDPLLEKCDDIILSYTFFVAKKGLKLPMPSYIKQHLA